MRLLFVGDIMLGRLVNDVFHEMPPDYVWNETLPLFAQADVRFCNLECVLSDSGEAADKPFTFRSDARNVAALTAAQIDAVSLANNHVLDYGVDAFVEMRDGLDNAGIAHAGAGMTRAEAQTPAYVAAPHGERIGMIAATDTSPEWDAQDGNAGVWHLPIDVNDERAQEMLNHVRDVASDVDILIASLHWGSNWGNRPEAGQQEFAHGLIDAGASIVHGHSPHVFRGVEVYGDGVIFYSTGDFINDYAVDEGERNDQSFIFMVDTENSTLRRVLMRPTVIERFQARIPSELQAEAIADRMRMLCRELGTEAVWDLERQMLEVTH